MAETSIEWCDHSINPIRVRHLETGAVGHYCEKISSGCTNCYASKLQSRFRMPAFGGHHKSTIKRGANDEIIINDHLQVFLDESKLAEVVKRKKPTRYFWCDMTDMFGWWVLEPWIDKCFEAMWKTPQHTHMVLTKRPDRMVEYIRDHASRNSFGWTDIDRTPFSPGDVIHLEDIYCRNQCGYVGDVSDEKDWVCDHPDNEERGCSDSCQVHGCPIARNVASREGLAKIDLADQYTFDNEGYACDSEWMELLYRPLHAGCKNVWLGFSAENQQQFNDRARVFRGLRHSLGPHYTLFASLEPLLEPIDTHIKYWEENEDDCGLWSPLESVVYKDGGNKYPVPYLNWLIVGGESGPGARPCHLDWFGDLVRECAQAKVPCFVKQLGANHWNYDPEVDMVRRVPLKHKKGGDMSEWPEDLRVREWPVQKPEGDCG